MMDYKYRMIEQPQVELKKKFYECDHTVHLFANELYNSSSDHPDCFKLLKNLFKNSIQDLISQTQIIAKTWYT